MIILMVGIALLLVPTIVGSFPNVCANLGYVVRITRGLSQYQSSILTWRVANYLLPVIGGLLVSFCVFFSENNY